MSCNRFNEATTALTDCNGSIATAAITSNSSNELQKFERSSSCRKQLQRMHCKCSNQLQQLQWSCSCRNNTTVALQQLLRATTIWMKLQLQKIIAKVALSTSAATSCNSCNKAAPAETHCNGLTVTTAISCNNCKEAAAAETHWKCCVATVAMTCNKFNEATAAETQWNGSVAAAAMSCNSCNEAAAA